jgi:pimeloyl-ACP methyl ester carboxylesterase
VLASYPLWTNDEPRLHMEAWDGDGPPMLLVHGMGAHTGWWESVGGLLAESSRPVALDLSGHGESAWRPNGDYSSQGWAGDIEEARHVLGWSTFTLVGHSLGARIALEYAAAHPERLDRLVVVDFFPGSIAGRFSRARSVPQPRYESEAAALSRFRLQPDGTVLDSAALEALGRRSVKKLGGAWTWKYDWRAFRYKYEPVAPVLPRVRVPALVVRGGLSTVMTEDDLKAVTASLPGSRGLTIPQAHHHVPLDAPEELVRALL